MTEQEKKTVKQMWEMNEPISQIVKMLPYKKNVAKQLIFKMRADGEILPRGRRKGVELVRQAYESGMTDIAEICETYQLKRSSVLEYLWRSGIKIGRKHQKRVLRPFSEQSAEIINLLEKGEKQSEIARKFGISRQRVSDIKKRHEKRKKNENL